MVPDSGFRVQGSGFRVQGSGFRVVGRWPGVASPQPSWTPPLSRRGCISTCPFRLPLPPPPRTRRHLRIGARNVKRFRGGLVFKAHRRLYHSTLDLRVIKQRRRSYRRTRRSSGGACLLPASYIYIYIYIYVSTRWVPSDASVIRRRMSASSFLAFNCHPGVHRS